MDCLIYGGGAVGLGLGSCLIKAGAKVTIIARPQTVEALSKDGLIRTGIFGTFHAKPDIFEAYQVLDQTDKAVYKYLLVCTKSFDCAGAAKDIYAHRHILGPGSRIVLCQNGWGNVDLFGGLFAPEVIYNARIITGFERLTPNHVKVTVHAAPISIGSLFGAQGHHVTDLAAAIDAGGIPCQTTNTIGKDLWAKMLFNCTLNPLGAILDVPYGALGSSDSTRFIMDRVIEEIFVVLAAAGLSTHWQSPQDFIEVFYRHWIPQTAVHTSSMLQDIRAGKRTEIDALNGQVIRLGQKYGIATPYNHALYQLVMFLQGR